MKSANVALHKQTAQTTELKQLVLYQTQKKTREKTAQNVFLQQKLNKWFKIVGWLSFLPARRCASAGTSYGPVFAPVTSPCSVKRWAD